MIKRHIPNTITCLNLASGCIATVMAFEGHFGWVVFLTALAALFDFLDGLSARLLKAYSPMGKELDSLADLVSFGVVPAVSVFTLLSKYSSYPLFIEPLEPYIPYLAFLIVIFSALRLAKFNIDDRQTSSFIGLPTPANALFWIGYTYGLQTIAGSNEKILYSTIGFIFILSLLMVSEVPMFSLKLKKLAIKGNEKVVLIAVIMIALVSLFGIIGLSWGILSYIAISIISKK